MLFLSTVHNSLHSLHDKSRYCICIFWILLLVYKISDNIVRKCTLQLIKIQNGIFNSSFFFFFYCCEYVNIGQLWHQYVMVSISTKWGLVIWQYQNNEYDMGMFFTVSVCCNISKYAVCI